MIKMSPLSRILRQNLRRNLKHLVLSSIGIVFGILVFFITWALSQGMNRVVHEIFPIDRIEVIAPKTSLTGQSAVLDDSVVAMLAARPEVRTAVPKMKLAFPAKGAGNLLGSEFHFEVGGFSDGIDQSLVAGDPGMEIFKDWEAEEATNPPAACAAPPAEVCPTSYYCGPDSRCHHRVPVLVSRLLVEMYNSSFAPSHGMPRVGAAQEAILMNRMKAMKFNIILGDSIVKNTSVKLLAAPETVEGQVIGISNKAMPIGMTVPLGYIKRWNMKFAGPESAAKYSSIVVDLKDRSDLGDFVGYIKSQGLEQEDSYGEQIALMVSIVTAILLGIAFLICFLSAINIAHTFFMVVADRKREIGLMRAVGATRGDIAKILLGEAAVVGFCGGLFGVALGYAGAQFLNMVFVKVTPDFPFKPSSFFSYSPWLFVAALAFAMLFCVLGAVLPARKAARIHPAQALTG
jgi:putative ABC transport system permease protein